jgi:hypothetical protein
MSKIVGSNMRDGCRENSARVVGNITRKNQAEDTSVLPLLQYTFLVIFFRPLTVSFLGGAH